MAKFTDSEGDQWLVRVTVREYSKIRNQLEIDLYKLFTDESQMKIFDDPLIWTTAIYYCCESQCDKRQIDEAEFFGRLYGDCLDDAVLAFIEAVRDFFPKGLQRRAIDVLLKAQAGRQNKMTQNEDQIISQLESQIEALMSSDIAGSPQEQQASPTPETSPSEN